MIRCKAAILQKAPGDWDVLDVEMAPPQQDELLIRMGAAGLCHSDNHILNGDLQIPAGALPMSGGHEGAGVVEEVGPNTPGWAVGDKVVLSFMPMCGRCKWCTSGMANLCDNGKDILAGTRPDGTKRMFLDGKPLGQAAGVATFSEYSTVSVMSAVKVPSDIPIEAAALTSCGVATGWGAAVNSAEVKPGHVVIVDGIGGIGMNAVQGAAHAGATVIIAVDPVAFKRESSFAFGATHAVATMEEATEIARGFTNGQGADSAIECVGQAKPSDVAACVRAIRKAGICVMVGMGAMAEDTGLPFAIREVVLYQKRLQGSLYGACSPARDVPILLDLYRQGRLKLDELITTKYPLTGINQGFTDMREGRNIRGVIVY